MFTMRIEGAADLARVLNQLPSATSRKVVLDALRAGATLVQAPAAAHAPRSPDPPHLAMNIGISAVNRVGSTEGGRWWQLDEADEFAVAVGPTKDFFYGLFQEYGTVDHAAQPFMRPAFDTGAPRALNVIGALLWAALRRHLAQQPTATPQSWGRVA